MNQVHVLIHMNNIVKCNIILFYFIFLRGWLVGVLRVPTDCCFVLSAPRVCGAHYGRCA